MQIKPNTNKSRSSVFLLFLWLFLATALIKVDNEEAVHPFFRLMIFLVLPFALLQLGGLALGARFSAKSWVWLFLLGYLIIYPLATIAFEVNHDDLRQIKDVLYNLSIYCIFFAAIKYFFSDTEGYLDVQRLGRFWVLFATWQSIFAVAFFMGLRVPIGFGFEFRQMEGFDNRLHGFMGTPSHLGPVVAVACAFLVTQKLTIPSALKLAFLLVVLVMTGSRGSLVGFLGAVGLKFLLSIQHFRLRLGALLPLTFGVGLVACLVVVFTNQSADVVSMATRADPEGWEKSRPVMWALRFEEYAKCDLVTQMFGAGHRAVGQTFNVNIDFLVNYGLVYLLFFNGVFMAVCWKFLKRSYRARDPNAAFVLMIGMSSYLFMQGLNPIFYAFIHGTQICMVIILIAYFKYRAPTASSNLLSGRMPNLRCSTVPL